jgi:hypothetical protein
VAWRPIVSWKKYLLTVLSADQSIEHTTRRRSSLYQNAQAAGQYLNMTQG